MTSTDPVKRLDCALPCASILTTRPLLQPSEVVPHHTTSTTHCWFRLDGWLRAMDDRSIVHYYYFTSRAV